MKYFFKGVFVVVPLHHATFLKVIQSSHCLRFEITQVLITDKSWSHSSSNLNIVELFTACYFLNLNRYCMSCKNRNVILQNNADIRVLSFCIYWKKQQLFLYFRNYYDPYKKGEGHTYKNWKEAEVKFRWWWYWETSCGWWST